MAIEPVRISTGKTLVAVLQQRGKFAWSTLRLDGVVCTVHGEIAGKPRTFYGRDDGYVVEADTGTGYLANSTNGQNATIPVVKMRNTYQRSPNAKKQYRGVELSVNRDSSMSVQVIALCDDAQQDTSTGRVTLESADPTASIANVFKDTRRAVRERLHGSGSSVEVQIGTIGRRCLVTFESLTIAYTTRRNVR